MIVFPKLGAKVYSAAAALVAATPLSAMAMQKTLDVRMIKPLLKCPNSGQSLPRLD
jgi:hypothetical protein